MAEVMRRKGLHTVAVTLTAGSRITGGRLEVNLPTSVMFSSLYAVVAQHRLMIGSGIAGDLIEELKGVEVTATDAGNVRYASEGTDHHGDLAFALGIAITVAERLTGRRQRAVTLSQRKQIRERPMGTRRYDNAARRRIAELREQREREWANTVRLDLTPGLPG